MFPKLMSSGGGAGGTKVPVLAPSTPVAWDRLRDELRHGRGRCAAARTTAPKRTTGAGERVPATSVLVLLGQGLAPLESTHWTVSFCSQEEDSRIKTFHPFGGL